VQVIGLPYKEELVLEIMKMIENGKKKVK